MEFHSPRQLSCQVVRDILALLTFHLPVVSFALRAKVLQ